MARKPMKTNHRDADADMNGETAGVAVQEAEAPKSGKRIAKAKAVRAAIDAGKATPDEGVAYVKKTFGLEVSKPHFSAIKSQYKSAGSLKSKPGPKPKSSSMRVDGYLAPPPRSAASGDILETLEALKPLIAQHGAERLKRLVDLIG